MKRILTIEDLVSFCETNKFSKFSSDDNGYRISVQVPSAFESNEDGSEDGMMRLKIKTSHTLRNRNGSYISEASAKEAMPSLKMRPVLAAIHQLESGEWDFDSHNMEIIENENGETEVNYIEKQVGAFTQEEPFLEYDEKEDKTFICAYAAIPEGYTKAADILRRKGGTKVSCEILIDSFSYNAKEKFLDIEKYRYEGVTLLGTHKYADGTEEEVGEGMLGSRADIIDFSAENNSLFSRAEINEKLIDTLEKLNNTLKGFNIKNTEGKEEEIVDKEKFEDEVIETSEEVVETSTEEVTDTSEEVTEIEEVSEETVDETPEETVEEKTEEFSKQFEVKFEISHDEIKYALYNLLGQFEELDNEWYFIRSVYDNYFVMQGWMNGCIYGCQYEKNKDAVSLVGERYKLYEELLTESEKVNLDEMRANYSVINDKLSAYEKAELDAQKDAVFADESYKDYLEMDEFKSLISDKENYSVEELKDKAEIAFARCVKKAGTFSVKETDEKTKISKHVFAKANKKEVSRKPYGNIFANKKL